MYESFFQFREKPFSLLPDAGFLFLSDKHRMALTLLEYGLMNQAGFTVISGDIGTGKTTLIRRLLNEMTPDLKVGLISNTHQTFGDLMQWIALAFELPYHNRNKVELYQDFMDFVIAEYARGGRTVLIVDEAQNMSADTLEELRMLSNVNADKDQVLQIILVGQRELRSTLQRPDLEQFAQRIAVNYHLEPLDQAETAEYIRHRCTTAGGRADLFSDQACELIYESSGGVPRLINQLCDTALVYAYAEQRDRIDAALVRDVTKDKSKSGLFPTHQARQAPQEAGPAATAASPLGTNGTKREPAAGSSAAGNGLNIAIAAESELLRIYLTRLLSRFDLQVTDSVDLTTGGLQSLDPDKVDVLLVELDDHLDRLDQALYEMLVDWDGPVLFNDSLATEASLSQPNRLEYGRKLCQKLYSLVPDAPQSVA